MHLAFDTSRSDDRLLPHRATAIHLRGGLVVAIAGGVITYTLMHMFTNSEELRAMVEIVRSRDKAKIRISKLVRASGSVGANYIEGNEALSKKDFRMRIKICRKEAKESRYWLRLLNNEDNENLKADLEALIQEPRVDRIDEHFWLHPCQNEVSFCHFVI